MHLAPSPLTSAAALRGAAADDGHLVAGEVVLRQQLADLELDEVEDLGVVDEVALVHEHDDGRHDDLAGEQDVLARLGHGAVGRGHDEDRAVHLGRAGDHVLDVVGVAGAVDVGVVPLLAFVLDVAQGDRQDLGRVPAEHLGIGLGDVVIALRLGQALGRQDLGYGRRQRRLAVVDVTDGPDVDMGLRPRKLFFRHHSPPVWLTKFGPKRRPGRASVPRPGRRCHPGRPGRPFVAREFHGENAAALGQGPERRRVAEHLGQGDMDRDDAGAARISMPSILPRRALMSPMMSPRYSSGATTSSS